MPTYSGRMDMFLLVRVFGAQLVVVEIWGFENVVMEV